MSKQKTAVEWLHQRLQSEPFLTVEDFNTAKEMERKQHKATADFWSGNENGIPKKYFEHYYNETYGTFDN